MPSLRDRLRAAMPVKPAEGAVKKPDDGETAEKTKKPEESVICRSHAFSAESFGLPRLLEPEALYLVFGERTEAIPLESVLFLDTETTGLSGGAGTIAFEIGIGRFTGNSFVIDQYVLKDYDGEGAMLERIRAALEGKRAVCTFNGKTFDMPLLASRFVMNRMRLKEELYQMDLLHASRRVWKLRLGRCALSALEEQVLGRGREEDLPGAQVPQRFFDYLKTKDEMLFEDVLRHNLQDVKSLAEILRALLDAHEDPLSLKKQEDIYSVGLVLQKRGRDDRARVCYRQCENGSLSALSRIRAAELEKKEGNWQTAANIYETMIRASQGGLHPMIALAKLYEHRLDRPEDAMKLTRRAMGIAAERNDPLLGELRKRYIRLMKKTRRNV